MPGKITLRQCAASRTVVSADVACQRASSCVHAVSSESDAVSVSAASFFSAGFSCGLVGSAGAGAVAAVVVVVVAAPPVAGGAAGGGAAATLGAGFCSGKKYAA